MSQARDTGGMTDTQTRSLIDIALDAAFPGLPDGMTMEEARRRIVKALVVVEPLIRQQVEEAGPPAPTDPRIGPLLNLTQVLILRYGELASNVAEYLPDNVKAELIDRAQTLMREAQDAYAEIAAMPTA